MNIKLLIENPRIANEWDYEKNEINIDTVSVNSTYDAYWRCEKGHFWQAKVVSRIKRNSSCPYCTGRRAITGENDVATLYPNLAREFHPTKNGSIKLDNLKESSGKKVWWKCKNGHEWEAVINTRTKRGYGCPVCSGQKIVSGVNDFLTLYPDLAKEVHPDMNDIIDLSKVSGKSSRIIKWICKKGHSYEASISKRSARGDGCPYCSGHKAILGETDLQTLHPEVLKYWDESANGSASNYTAKSGKLVLWKCEKGHSWSKRIAQQVNHNTCHECAGEVLVKGVNDVATKYPELICEWDWDNNKKAPTDIKASVQLKCWWKCEKSHSYEATIWNRKLGKGCPFCSGKRPIAGKNDLKTLFPYLAEEWDYELNRKGPDEYLPKSNSKVWWRCICGHTWKAQICERTRGTGCPKCNNRGKG